MKIRLFPKPKDPKAPLDGHSDIFRAISTGERDIGIFLRLLDERLRALEKRPFPTIENIKDFNFNVDAEAIVLLKALYVHTRIYLDAIAGVLQFFHRRMNLPKSFNALLKKIGTSAIPNDLSQVLSSVPKWFSQFRKTRVNLVHDYEDFLLLFYGKGDEKEIHHASLTRMDRDKAFDYGSIRSSVGGLLKDIQVMVDDLLDHFDARFYEWYGFVQSPTSRTQTMFEDGYMLYWAYKYGGYSHPDLHVQENESLAALNRLP
jgi:hypothetical protein